MDRIKDQVDSKDPVVARAASLLRATRPLEPSAERRERVRVAMLERDLGPRRRLVLRPALALGVLLLASAATAAVTWMVATRWAAAPPADVRAVSPPPISVEARRAMSGERVAPAPSPVAAPPAPPVAAPARPVAAPIAVPAEAPEESPPARRERVARSAEDRSADDRSPEDGPEPSVSPSPAVVEPRPPAVVEPRPPAVVEPRPPAVEEDEIGPVEHEVDPVIEPEPVEPASEEPGRPRPSDEASTLLFAARAMRGDRDAGAASKLVDDYLRRYPNGALLEEALALGIEAATAMGSPRAADLAARYLDRFPDGRFREAAIEAYRRFRK